MRAALMVVALTTLVASSAGSGLAQSLADSAAVRPVRSEARYPTTIQIQRQGMENPVLEVAKTTVWGGLAGLVLGGAFALAMPDNANNGDFVKWGFIGGTALGFFGGIAHINSRPDARALLEIRDGTPSLHPVVPMPEPGQGLAMNLVKMKF